MTPMAMSLELKVTDQAALEGLKIDVEIARLPDDGQDYRNLLAPILSTRRSGTA